jgi:hypothetical protein
MFASIPYNNYVKNNIASYEGYYSSVIFVFLKALGFEVIAEDVTNRGRIDLTIKAVKRTIIMEFKMDSFKESPLHQIHTRKYYAKYLSEGVPIYLIGIKFSEKKRNIIDYQIEKL